MAVEEERTSEHLRDGLAVELLWIWSTTVFGRQGMEGVEAGGELRWMAARGGEGDGRDLDRGALWFARRGRERSCVRGERSRGGCFLGVARSG